MKCMHACTAMQVQMGMTWYVLYELVKRNQQTKLMREDVSDWAA